MSTSTRSIDKTLPNNPEAEVAVLGSLLIDPQAISEVVPILRSDDYYQQKHAWIYAAQLDLYQRNEPLDFVTLTTELEHREQLESVGGAAYIATLIQSVPSAINVKSYAQIVKNTAIRRHALNFASDVARLAYDEQADITTVLDNIEDGAFALRKDFPTDRLQKLTSVLDSVREDLTETQSEHAPLISTGFPDLDKKLGGWRRGALYTIGASTGRGKTALLLKIGTNAALAGRTVLIFSLEMSAKNLAERLIAAQSGVSLVSLTSKQSLDTTWPSIEKAVEKLKPHPLWIDDTAAISIPELRSQVKRFALHHPLDLVLMDYLQLARLGQRVEKRYLEVGLISQELKRLSREVNVPIIAAAQLSRAVDQRIDKRPQLSDLRESGNIEQDSDAVLLIHREESGTPHTPTTLIVGKNRNGPTGDITLIWSAQKISFFNSAQEASHE